MYLQKVGNHAFQRNYWWYTYSSLFPGLTGNINKAISKTIKQGILKYHHCSLVLGIIFPRIVYCLHCLYCQYCLNCLHFLHCLHCLHCLQCLTCQWIREWPTGAKSPIFSDDGTRWACSGNDDLTRAYSSYISKGSFYCHIMFYIYCHCVLI